MDERYENETAPEEGRGVGEFNRFIPRFIATLVSPKELYEDIDRGAHWWQPWAWLSLINIVSAQIFKPIYIHLARLNPNDVPEEQLEQTIEAMDKFWFVGILSTPVQMLILLAMVAGVSYIVLSVLAEESRFKKYLCLTMYASIPVWIGALLGVVVARMKDLSEINNFQDATVSFGPAAFLDPEQKMIYPFLSTLDVFSVWFYALLALGVMHIFRLSGRSAIFVVLPVYLVMVLIEFLRVQFS